MKHILGFSGGIDSQACARWLLNRYAAEDVILLNTQAGRNESPVTVQFVKEYSETIHPVIEVVPIVADLWAEGSDCPEKYGFNPQDELTMDLMIQIKGRTPSRTMQFCTQFLKMVPMRRWVEKEFGPDGQYPYEPYERYTGIRRDESDRRKNTPLRAFDGFFSCWVNHVIADWTKEMCFVYVKAHDESVNLLYLQGFSRVGCICINSSKEEILTWSQRYPEMIDMVRERERKSGVTYFAPMVPGMEMNFIDDVVRWAQTDRGGRQSNMFKILNERPSCESKYGLCE